MVHIQLCQHFRDQLRKVEPTFVSLLNNWLVGGSPEDDGSYFYCVISAG